MSPQGSHTAARRQYRKLFDRDSQQIDCAQLVRMCDVCVGQPLHGVGLLLRIQALSRLLQDGPVSTTTPTSSMVMLVSAMFVDRTWARKEPEGPGIMLHDVLQLTKPYCNIPKIYYD